MKLTELSKEQMGKMSAVKQYWLNYIFSCKNSVDREKAKIGIDWLYRFVGRQEPIVIFVDSPMACQYAVLYVKEFVKKFPQLLAGDQVRAQVGDQVWDQVGAQVWDQVGDQVRDQVWAQVWDQVWDQVGDQVRAQVGAQVWDQVRAQVGAQVWAQVRDQVRDQVGDQVRDQVWAQVWDQVGDQVRDQVWAQVWAQVWDQVGAQVRAQVRDQVRDQVWDQNFEFTNFGSYPNVGDYGWVSFYDFFTQIGVINHEGFNQFKAILDSGVYDTIQLNGFCIVSDMPKKLVRNNSGRLHNPAGPAIEFADGYKQYYVNGRALPSWIWEKAAAGEITREMFLQEENSEIKGGIYEVLGQKKMMDLLGAKEIDHKKIIHANGDTETVTLLKTKEKFEEIGNLPFAWVKMVCPSTGSVYLQGVEPHHKNALDAIASLSPFKAEEYSFNMRS